MTDQRRLIVVGSLLVLLFGAAIAESAASSHKDSGPTRGASATSTTDSSSTPTDAAPVEATPTETPTPEPPPDPLAGLDVSERKYVAATKGDDLGSPKHRVYRGHLLCRWYEAGDSGPEDDLGLPLDTPTNPPKKKASDKAVATMMIDDDDSIDEDVVKYLCSERVRKDYAWAMAGITEGGGDVGGKDGIRPGTYRTTDSVGECYWERTTPHGGTIDNDYITHARDGATVTIRSTDGSFDSEGCGSWLPLNRPGD